MTGPAGGRPLRIGVTVPAHDEQDELPGCFDALARAAATTDVPVHVVVVLDACTDASAAAVPAASAVFASMRVGVVQARRVGVARRHGMAMLLAALPTDRLWLATTDADSRVPIDWFGRQVRHATAGADAVAGTVVVRDWSGRPDALRRQYGRRYRAADEHRHVHGANLSLRADAYVAAGGFAALASDEDVTLVAALQAHGRSIVWAADLPVRTSARRDGRAPAGFAAHLDALARLA